MARKQEYIRWAIYGECGLYTGQHQTRKEAVSEHLEMLYGKLMPGTEEIEAWKECRARGDRAVKVRISVVGRQD